MWRDRLTEAGAYLILAGLLAFLWSAAHRAAHSDPPAEPVVLPFNP